MARHCIFTDIMVILQHTASDPAFANRFASVVAGLCTGAGAGLLVLFKMNKDKRENLKILSLLYVIGVLAGMILELFA